MANEPDQKWRLELEYRAGHDDLRPVRETDHGCALFFVVIAISMLALIAWIVGFDWRRRGITFQGVLLISGLGLFAGMSIIAVCGRLTQHRWWGNRDWKELFGKGRREDGG